MDNQLLADLALEADPSLPDFFLGRLAALMIRQAAATTPNMHRVLGTAILSTYLDCVDLGLTEQACAIIDYVRDYIRDMATPGTPAAELVT
jgi:hypothetical protein